MVFYFKKNTKDLIQRHNPPNGGVRGGTIRLLPVDSTPRQYSKLFSSHTASADQPQTKIVQPWLINAVFTDGYDAGQMYRLLVR